MRESISTFGLLCALKKSIFESYVNKPLRLHMPTKLKHFTQLAKNTQFSSVFFSLVFFSSFFSVFLEGEEKELSERGSSGNMACAVETPPFGGRG